jgi:probable F420-dependent oxidoreductase
MHVGVMALQTWSVGSRSPGEAYAKSLELAIAAERLGFESVWAWDHVLAGDDPRETAILEPFILLTSIAACTSRVRIGHMVLCAGFRNPALTAKMAATLDVASGGRLEVGIGAGWKESEWRSYGYGFPSVADRTAALGEQVEIIAGMLRDGSATFAGRFARADDAITVPKGIQASIPIVIGGNGRRTTRRIAARRADELNLVYVPLEKMEEELEITRETCRAAGRDPETLRVSIYPLEADIQVVGRPRVDLLEAYGRLGITRVVANLDLQDGGSEALQAFATDCLAAPSVTLAG